MRYAVLVLLTALFSVAYFVFLRASIDMVLSGVRGGRWAVPASFFLRYLFAAVFFYVMLMSYSGPVEIALMLAVFIVARCFMIRYSCGRARKSEAVAK